MQNKKWIIFHIFLLIENRTEFDSRHEFTQIFRIVFRTTAVCNIVSINVAFNFQDNSFHLNDINVLLLNGARFAAPVYDLRLLNTL